ncbi:MAG: ABC transporter permease [Tannerellaceae bacterium]
MIQHYLKIALRNLLKYKTHSLISAICLSVGMVCFSIVGFFIDKIEGSIHSLPYYERRVDFKMPIENNPDKSQIWLFRANEIKVLEEKSIPGVELISYHSFKNDAEMLFIDKEQQELPFQLNYRTTNNAFFTFYDAKLLYGTRLPQTPDEVVISESCARKVCGKQNPIDMLVTFVTTEEKREKKFFRIVNVVSDLDMELSIEADVFIPYEESTFMGILQVQGLLTADADFKEVNRLLEQMKVSRDTDTMHYIVTRLADRYSSLSHNAFILFIRFLSSLILLSGIINFLKFIIQMFYNRQRELALRKCMGSDSKGLFCLLFAEVGWMFTVTLFLSLAMTEIVVPWICSYIPAEKMIPHHPSELIENQILIYLKLLVVCILVILIPIYRLQHVSVIHRIHRNHTNHGFRHAMLGVQLCICIFFLGIASNMAFYLEKMSDNIYNPLSKNETERIIRLNINSITLNKQKETVLADIRQMADIEHIVFTYRSEKSHSSGYTYVSYQKANGNSIQLLMQGGSPDYFTLFHIPLQGKQSEAEAKGVVYISEAFALQLEQDSVKGMVTLNEETYRIGGIYKGLYKEELNSKYIQGSVFFPSEEAYSFYFQVGVNGDVDAAIKKIEEICRRYVSESISLSIYKLDEEKQMSYSVVELARDIAALLAGISLLLVVLSIYSSISLDTMNRRKEVAIRKINGATPRIIALIFGKSYCIIYLLAFAVAFPLTYLLTTQILSDNSFLSTFNFWLWGMGLFIGIAALIVATTAFKIHRIMHINPAEIIKSE